MLHPWVLLHLSKPALDALERLRFDHRSHLRQDPNQASAFLVLHFAGPHAPVDARCFRDEASERGQGYGTFPHPCRSEWLIYQRFSHGIISLVFDDFRCYLTGLTI
jgi:hypothetical protein